MRILNPFIIPLKKLVFLVGAIKTQTKANFQGQDQREKTHRFFLAFIHSK